MHALRLLPAPGTARIGGPIELDDYQFVDAGDLDRYLPPFISARVVAALRGRDAGATVYLAWP